MVTNMSSRNNSDIQDIVKEVVQVYLCRRSYMADGDESGGPSAERTHALQEMAADTVAEGASSISNSFVYSSAMLDPATAETQFTRFRAWVLDAPEPYQSELQQLLFPIFVNLHLELVTCGHAPSRFYSRHHGPFLFCSEHSSAAADLAAITTSQELARSRLKNFRSSPPEVTLSADCAEYLRRALRSTSLSLVLHMINQHVALTVPADAAAGEAESGRAGRRRYPTGLQRGGTTPTDDSSGELQRAISRLSAEPPPPPTICAYRVSRPLSCSEMSSPRNLLAAGDERGATVWALTPLGLPPGHNPAARVPLGGGPRLDDDDEATPSRALRAHAGPVYDMAFGADGDVLVTAGEDTTLRAWSSDSWANVCIYRGHTYPVWSVRSQPAGGHYFVSGAMDRTARLWTYDRTYQLRIFAGHTQDVDCVALHPNGNYVASASGDGTVRLWTVTDALQVRVLSAHHGVVHDLRFSPDGRLLAAAGEDQHVRVYDLGQGSLVHDLKGHLAPVSCLLWTQGGRTLVSADRDGTVNTWNLRDKASVPASPASTFLCPGWSAVNLHYAPHNYLVAVYGEQDS